MIDENHRPDRQSGRDRPPESAGEDETFPEGFRMLMRRIFGPLNRLRRR